MTGMILIDLQKAFDTIDQGILLQKLYAIGFSKHTVNWFQSYLSNRSFLVNLGNNFSQPASVSCSVPQGSMTCHKLSNVICFYMLMIRLVFQHKDINRIENQLNEDFSNICDWFVDNKLSIHFGEDKTKSILFASKFKRKNI